MVSTFIWSSVVFDCHFPLELDQYRKHLHTRLLKQTEPFVTYYTYVGAQLSIFLGQLLEVKLALVFALVDEVVGNLDGAVGMVHRVPVLVDLTEQGTDLHVSLALVLKHFKSKRRLVRVAEVVAQVVALEVVQACL